MARDPSIAGRRLRVTLEAPAETPDGLGGVARVFVPVAALWARIETLRLGARAEADRAEAAATHRLTLRWREGVTAAMRVSAGARVFAILAAHDPDGRRRDLVCLVEEVSP